MFCSRCGRSLPEGAAFCPNCGASATTARAGAAEAVNPGLAPPLAAPPTPPSAPAPAIALYGGFWRRVLALVIDGLIQALVMLPFGMGLGLADWGLRSSQLGDAGTILAMIAASFLVWFLRIIFSWIYGAVFECSRWQATPGKMVLGLKVTDLEGQRIGFARALGRNAAKVLSSLILCIGYLMVAFTEKKQGLHDLLAGTVVRR